MDETQLMFRVCEQRNVPQAFARFRVPPSRGWRGILEMLESYRQLLLGRLIR